MPRRGIHGFDFVGDDLDAVSEKKTTPTTDDVQSADMGRDDSQHDVKSQASTKHHHERGDSDSSTTKPMFTYTPSADHGMTTFEIVKKSTYRSSSPKGFMKLLKKAVPQSPPPKYFIAETSKYGSEIESSISEIVSEDSPPDETLAQEANAKLKDESYELNESRLDPVLALEHSDHVDIDGKQKPDKLMDEEETHIPVVAWSGDFQADGNAEEVDRKKITGMSGSTAGRNKTTNSLQDEQKLEEETYNGMKTEQEVQMEIPVENTSLMLPIPAESSPQFQEALPDIQEPEPAIQMPQRSATITSKLFGKKVTEKLNDRSKVLQDVMIPKVLLQGDLFYKLPYYQHTRTKNAIPRRKWVRISHFKSKSHNNQCLPYIAWTDPEQASPTKNHAYRHSLQLADIVDVREGHSSKSFLSQLESSHGAEIVHESAKCFSIVTTDRTLDLVAASKEVARVWVLALYSCISHASTLPMTSTIASKEGSIDDLSRRLTSYRESALSPRSSRDTNQQDEAWTNDTTILSWREYLLYQFQDRNLSAIHMSLENGLAIDFRLDDRNGDTLLLRACRIGWLELVELCLAWHAKNDPHPEYGQSALQLAVAFGHSSCVEAILMVAAKSRMDSMIVNHVDSQNEAPIHVAARNGDRKCLEVLLLHGANLFVVQNAVQTPLHLATMHEHYDCVTYLLDIDGDAIVNACDKEGNTALHHAANTGNIKLVQLLLQSAADVNILNTYDDTAHEIAIRRGYQGCADLIASYFLPDSNMLWVPDMTKSQASMYNDTWVTQIPFEQHLPFGKLTKSVANRTSSHLTPLSARDTIRHRVAEKQKRAYLNYDRVATGQSYYSNGSDSSRSDISASSFSKSYASGLTQQLYQQQRRHTDIGFAYHQGWANMDQKMKRQSHSNLTQENTLSDVWKLKRSSDGSAFLTNESTGESRWANKNNPKLTSTLHGDRSKAITSRFTPDVVVRMKLSQRRLGSPNTARI